MFFLLQKMQEFITSYKAAQDELLEHDMISSDMHTISAIYTPQVRDLSCLLLCCLWSPKMLQYGMGNALYTRLLEHVGHGACRYAHHLILSYLHILGPRSFFGLLSRGFWSQKLHFLSMASPLITIILKTTSYWLRGKLPFKIPNFATKQNKTFCHILP